MKKIKFFLGWIAGVLMTVPFIRGYSAYDVKIVGYSPTENFWCASSLHRVLFGILEVNQ